MAWAVGQTVTAGQLNTYVAQTASTWTPTWTNVTVGNGTVVSFYARAGAIIVAQMRFTLGSTSAVSGAIQFSLPVNCDTTRGVRLGDSRIQDVSAPEVFASVVIAAANGTGQVQVLDSTNATSLDEDNTSGTVPMTWATGDVLDVNLCYLAN